jgi:alpha,alpha-trehalase
MHIVAIHGMEAYGFRGDALRIANKFLSLLLRQYQRTGQLWEKYNVVDGTLVLPNSRYGNVPMRGWTAAAVILLGQFLFGSKSVLAP